MNRWTTVFKALANINRLKIIKMLSKGQFLNVTQISGLLKISLKATSKHLIMLQSLGLLEATGKQGHVFYALSPQIPADLQKSINLFI